jgi:hypothetical protein
VHFLTLVGGGGGGGVDVIYPDPSRKRYAGNYNYISALVSLLYIVLLLKGDL